MLSGGTCHANYIGRSVAMSLTDLAGSHPAIEKGKYVVHYHELLRRVRRYREDVVPRFRQLHETKNYIVDQSREEMRLDEFKPRVLTSFVRNRLIDEVYLPLVGDNLAKQMGSAGEDKRTDRMGLLLLISPPGYGKTTLMEYIANRSGRRIHEDQRGPAIGHGVTSLDPGGGAQCGGPRRDRTTESRPGDGRQRDAVPGRHPAHQPGTCCRKFISLCDATRKIEGVRNGKTRTYDLRGRRVAVVMAGNPYTESGERFQIPDMLSNRADVYNLGEIIGDSADAFEMSYLENCLTSNPHAGAPLSTAPPEDARAIVRAAERDTMEGPGAAKQSVDGPGPRDVRSDA